MSDGSGDRDRVEAWLASFVSSSPPRGEQARQRSAELLDRLNRPQDRVPAIHVVGTAGKGTVALLVSEALRSQGQSVGLHSSPHVDDVRERFTVNSSLPGWDEVGAAIDEVAPAAQALANRGRPPTFFSVTTAVSLVMARQAATDWLVVEAGIGGRHDGTNVFNRPDVLTVVTAVGVDHQEVLGNDPVTIAAEKAAVMAGRRCCVLGPQPHRAVVEAVRGWATHFENQLVEVSEAGPWPAQARATATAVLEAVGSTAASASFVGTVGRYETQQWAAGTVIFDGAHNPLKLRGLAEVMAALPQPRLAIVALGEGKDLEACAEALVGVFDAVIVTEFGPAVGQPGPRSWPAAAVAHELRRRGQPAVSVAESVDDAAFLAREWAAPVTVVTGSFFHLAPLRSLLLADPTGP